MDPTAPVRDIVLLGAGHAHVEVLRRLALARLPGVRVTLVARARLTPYSGMLPALLRGEVTHAQAHIDCAELARRAGADLVLDSGIAIDRDARVVRCAGGETRSYDLLSINIGGVPRMPRGEGVPVKPIGQFLDRLAAIELGAGGRLAVIGTGAGGVELALALRHRVPVVLIGPAPVLKDAPTATQSIVRRALHAAGIEHVVGLARGFASGAVRTDVGPVEAAAALWATGVTAAPALAESGLACDHDGCVLVRPTLQSMVDPRVLAAGDCAAFAGSPRPKAGVWAVRAGAVLDASLRSLVAGTAPRSWRPQNQALVILGLGDGRAVAWRNGFTVSGRWVASWKARIDRRWMARYQAAV
jgi:selenide,water dikinase